MILAYFAVPEQQVQAKVLAWGIILALVLRLIFIVLGAALLDTFHVTFYFFGALLLYTAWKLARHEGDDIEPEHNPALKFIRKRVTMTEDYDGDKLFTKRNGARVATPLLAVFVVVATTDIVFADRLDPGDLRRHPGAVHRLRRQRVRADRPALALLPARRPDGQVRLPVRGARVHPRVHRREDAADRHLARADLAVAGA